MARTTMREPPTVNKQSQAKINGIERGIITPKKNENITNDTVAIKVPITIAHKAWAFI